MLNFDNDGYDFCIDDEDMDYDGIQTRKKWDFCPNCGMKFSFDIWDCCPNCGTERLEYGRSQIENSDFCPCCGEPQFETTNEEYIGIKKAQEYWSSIHEEGIAGADWFDLCDEDDWSDYEEDMLEDDWSALDEDFEDGLDNWGMPLKPLLEEGIGCTEDDGVVTLDIGQFGYTPYNLKEAAKEVLKDTHGMIAYSDGFFSMNYGNGPHPLLRIDTSYSGTTAYLQLDVYPANFKYFYIDNRGYLVLAMLLFYRILEKAKRWDMKYSNKEAAEMLYKAIKYQTSCYPIKFVIEDVLDIAERWDSVHIEDDAE